MEIENLNSVPQIKLETVQGKSPTGKLPKKITLPNQNKGEFTSKLDYYKDGKYYSVLGLCELFDKEFKQSKNNLYLYDRETKKEYRTADEIRGLLEDVADNLKMYIFKEELPEIYGYYIHESAVLKKLERLKKQPEILGERLKEKPEKQEKEERNKKIELAQQQYAKKDTKQEKHKNVKVKNLGKKIGTYIVVLGIISSTVVAISTYKPKEESKTYIVTIEQTIENVVENPDISNITSKEICSMLQLDQNYRIEQTKMYEASDHSGIYDNIEGNYTVSMVAYTDKDNSIKIIYPTDNKTKISELISKEELKTATNLSAALSKDGIIIGWIDINNEIFKELSQQIALEKLPPLTENYTITTDNLEQIIDPKTNETYTLINGVLYDELGEVQADLKVKTITETEEKENRALKSLAENEIILSNTKGYRR